MTMRECYEAIGGNYEDVLGRLHSEALIRRFTLKFLEDQSYIQLKQALEKVIEVYEMTIEEIKKGM
jgi:histidine phosphotransfer protein HptB